MISGFLHFWQTSVPKQEAQGYLNFFAALRCNLAPNATSEAPAPEIHNTRIEPADKRQIDITASISLTSGQGISAVL